MKKSIVTIVLAVNFLEWLEFSLYLYMAKSVFAEVFFPNSNHSLALTFALFAGAYLARPIGGWLFGRAADQRGRRFPMMLTAGLMGAATLGICLLPGYQQIGATSTWLLLLFRILQGLALGGEVNTSAMYLIEHHPDSPMLAGSLVAAFGALGMFLGAVLSASIQIIDISQLWRFVFALIGIISLSVCALRKNLTESPEFLSKKLISWFEFRQYYGIGVINIAMVALFVSVSVYMCNIFWLAFASQLHIWKSVTCAWIAAFAQLGSALIAIPLARYCSKSQARHLLQTSMLTIMIAAPLLFYFTYHKIIYGIALGLIGYMLANGLLCASLYYYLYQQLPTAIRCRGVSLMWAVAASLGAFTLPIAQQAVFEYNLLWAPGFMVSIIVMASFITIRYTNPRTQPLDPVHA